MKRRIALGLTLALWVFIATPAQAVVDRGICSADGYTAVYINGIFTDFNTAQDDKDRVWETFVKYSRKPELVAKTTFSNGYNAPHLGCLGDVIKSIQQKTWEAEGETEEDFDLLTIAKQLRGEVTTQKMLIIGHSQGTFYANALYDYLIRRG